MRTRHSTSADTGSSESVMTVISEKNSGCKTGCKTGRVWDTRTGKLIGICKGHTQGIGRLAFTPGDKTLVSVSSDSTLRFWNVSTQQELIAMKRIADPVQDLLFSPSGDRVILKTSTGLQIQCSGQPGAVTSVSVEQAGGQQRGITLMRTRPDWVRMFGRPR